MLICTIGHSTHEKEHFAKMLVSANIETLVDIRSYPGSRRMPHFGKDAMKEWVPGYGINYTHMVGLGGRKHTCADCSPNHWWTHQAFRSYADYALTDPFKQALKNLQGIASNQRVAIMCSEAQWWRCHRRIVTDYLLAADVGVKHIMGVGRLTDAMLSEGARPQTNGSVLYPPTNTERPQ